MGIVVADNATGTNLRLRQPLWYHLLLHWLHGSCRAVAEGAWTEVGYPWGCKKRITAVWTTTALPFPWKSGLGGDNLAGREERREALGKPLTWRGDAGSNLSGIWGRGDYWAPPEESSMWQCTWGRENIGAFSSLWRLQRFGATLNSSQCGNWDHRHF